MCLINTVSNEDGHAVTPCTNTFLLCKYLYYMQNVTWLLSTSMLLLCELNPKNNKFQWYWSLFLFATMLHFTVILFFKSILYRFLRPALHLLIPCLIGVDDTHRDHFMLKRVMTCERAWIRKRKRIATVVRPVISNLGIRIFRASVNPDWCVLLYFALFFRQREFICFLIVFTRSCLCSYFQNFYQFDQFGGFIILISIWVSVWGKFIAVWTEIEALWQPFKVTFLFLFSWIQFLFYSYS